MATSAASLITIRLKRAISRMLRKMLKKSGRKPTGGMTTSQQQPKCCNIVHPTPKVTQQIQQQQNGAHNDQPKICYELKFFVKPPLDGPYLAFGFPHPPFQQPFIWPPSSDNIGLRRSSNSESLISLFIERLY